MKGLTIILIGMLFSISFISAMSIDFFYSESCQYCQRMKPIMEQIGNLYKVNWYETSQYQNLFRSYGFQGVPAFIIYTDDGREVKFTGANVQKLNCELQEMSTKDCITHSADSCIDESWFIE